MRTLLITLALTAAMPATVVMAQPVDQADKAAIPPEEVPVGDTAVAPASSTPVPPVQVVPSSQAQPGAVPGPDGVIRQWGPNQAIVESVPPSPKSYPPCKGALQDGCTNPNPAKELPYFPADHGG